MAHGLNAMLKRGGNSDGKTGIGSRRIFAPQFKLQVLDSYRNDADCKGNQRATARKYGIHRRQIQKWLQVEGNLRNSVLKSKCGELSPEARKCGLGLELALSSGGGDRQRDDVQSQRHASAAEVAGEGAALPAVSAAAVDKRVPDIPQPVYTTLPVPAVTSLVTTVPVQHEWRRGSPVDSVHSSLSSTDTSSFTPPPQPHAPLDFTTHSRRSRSPTPEPDPAAPIDLSLKPPRYYTTSSPPPPLSRTPAPVCRPHISPPLSTSIPVPISVHPDIWDLSTKGVSAKRPLNDATTNTNPRPIKLFKPYLDHVIEEQYSPSISSFTPLAPPAVITSLDTSERYNIYQHHNNNNNYHSDYQMDYPLYDYYYNGGGLHFVREPFAFKGATGCIKQRQSYSLDFKLSAIECYYSDAVCRGNQRAVASKFKIHRRQVQKWLKQEDQLRQRMQPLNVVR